MLLTSRDNPELKNIRRLLAAGGASRRERGEFVAEGFKTLQFARRIQTVYAREGLEIPAALRDCRTRFVTPRIFDALTDTEHSQGILAVCRRPAPAAFSPAKKYVFLDKLQDPGNLGAVLRSAAAFGFDGVICNKGCADVFAPKTVRASAGAVFRLDILRGEIGELSGRILAAALDGAPPQKTTGGYVLAIGGEGRGLAAETLAKAAQKITLPFDRTKVESLNAAVAAGILMYLLQS
ncbi:MAG: RNA methyltransferase [Candidatus Margulisbacteria bacterium]|nr:RNA methyltransferase [Candidatus Margulisiibacteriota bacterium]